MNLLALETTCDETAAAVVNDRLEVLGAVVASQDDLHRRFGGVVPEIASRAHLERILPVIDEALRRAGVRLWELDAVAVANTPGLAGSLLVGLVAAKTLAAALEIPLVAVNHLQAHIYACRLASREDVFPCVGLIISGGHTSLYRCLGPLDFQLLGATIDDAAGEAFDKVAAMLGLPYPGGPSIQRAAAGGNPAAYRFPRAFLHEPQRLDFSFSGLKTAVRYTIAGPGRPDLSQVHLEPGQVADLAASFQEAVVDCLIDKALAATEKTGLRKTLRRRRRGRQCAAATAAGRRGKLKRRPPIRRPAGPLHGQRRDGRDCRGALSGRPLREPGPQRLPRRGTGQGAVVFMPKCIQFLHFAHLSLTARADNNGKSVHATASTREEKKVVGNSVVGKSTAGNSLAASAGGDADRDLERRVMNFLVGRQVPSLRQIAVEADRGTVILRGRVYSFHHKQLCINCCTRVAGVLRLVDELTVATPSNAKVVATPIPT